MATLTLQTATAASWDTGWTQSAGDAWTATSLVLRVTGAGSVALELSCRDDDSSTIIYKQVVPWTASGTLTIPLPTPFYGQIRLRGDVQAGGTVAVAISGDLPAEAALTLSPDGSALVADRPVIVSPDRQTNMSTVLLGSSTTSRCIYVQGGGNLSANTTLITWERIYGYWFHLQAALGSPFRLIGEFHATDQDTAAVNALIPQVLALKPAFCFYQPLANNLGSNQTFASCRHFVEEGLAQLLGAGIKVILVTSTPRETGEAGTWSAAKGLEYSKFSAWAYTQQDKYREQLFVLDNWRQGVDPSAADGAARANLLSSDHMHTWEYGCQVLGRQSIGSVLENHLRGLGFVPQQWKPSANVERSVLMGAGVSPNFVGANVAATGWTVSDGTGSLVATDDGAGNWLRITFDNNPASRLNPRAFLIMPVNRLIVGHRYQMEGWLRTSEPVMGLGIRLRTMDAGAVVWDCGGQADPGSSDVRRRVGGSGVNFKIVSRTITLSQAAYDAFLALNANMALQAYVYTQISADGTGTGAATFDIRDLMLRDLDA